MRPPVVGDCRGRGGETRGSGYRLAVNAGALDVDRFEALLAAGRDAAPSDPGRAADTLREALELWRGPALADLAYEPFLQAEIGRLEESGASSAWKSGSKPTSPSAAMGIS